MPAILKGWCDRVLSEGFAHKPSENEWFDNGCMAGKRLLLNITTNGRSSGYSQRGRHGSMNIILWPIMNAFWFSGFDVVKPFIAFNVTKTTDSRRKKLLDNAAKYALTINEAEILKVHKLEDYDINGQLKKNINPSTPGQQQPDSLSISND